MKRSIRKTAKRLFLESFALQGVSGSPHITVACKYAGISRALFYVWLHTDPQFYAKYEALMAVYYHPVAANWTQDDWNEHYKSQQKGKQLIRYYQKRTAPRLTVTEEREKEKPMRD